MAQFRDFIPPKALVWRSGHRKEIEAKTGKKVVSSLNAKKLLQDKVKEKIVKPK